MVATHPERASGNLAHHAGGALLGCLLLFGGCVPGRETTLSRTARQREVEAERAVAARAVRDLDTLRQQTGEANAQIAAAKAASVRAAAELRSTLAQLRHELGLQRAAEQDLAAARARVAAIEQELAPLRAVEQQVRDQERLRSEAAARLAALQAEVAAAEQATAARAAELQPRLAVLQQQIAAAGQIDAALAAAQAAIAAAVGTFLPAAPAPAPGTAPQPAAAPPTGAPPDPPKK